MSVTMPMWKLAFRITDYSFWKYEQHKNFHQEMSSELIVTVRVQAEEQAEIRISIRDI